MLKRIAGAVSVAAALAFGAIGLASARQPSGTAGPPAVVRAVAPFFNPIAATANAAGDVVAEVEINPAGKVTSVNVVSGAQLLRESVREAASRWEFAPSEGADSRRATLTFGFEYVWKSHGQYRPEELTPVFVPPYKVVVVRDRSDR